MVDPQTRTAPGPRSDGESRRALQAGHVRAIHLDSSARETVLTVPAAAVVEIEGQKFVFVPVKKSPENRSFYPRPVELGRQTGDRVVIKAGLTGDKVVSSGSFMLKSELILQNQADEE